MSYFHYDIPLIALFFYFELKSFKHLIINVFSQTLALFELTILRFL